ncbi:MAG: YqcI/YcgG family protein [Candidatus Eremiobacteraeota bacterium]|nr:YqcI/YcgG family protein [Candidatus Eremiobacteraeota bacterium]MBC5822082.1 YqcI/YcgG family protein [Candidatus Eremiobacteraeota bacterium]
MSTADELQWVWEHNPFSSELAKAHSTYAAYDGTALVRLLETAPPSPFARTAHTAFRGFVSDEAFSCLGARAAISRRSYRFGAYRRLDDNDVTAGLARDLFAFVTERRGFGSTFTTYVATFAESASDAEAERSFERALWGQLQRLHDLDRQFHAWDARVACDPEDPRFSYSFAGTAFFVVGLHPHSPRRARRFAWPTLVFNAHEQFEQLRADGSFSRLQTRIRERELALDGSLNFNLTEYGERSEARQYAGHPVPDDWRCPFRPR